MKTPRDLLLEKHRAANPQLDALRHRVVAGLPAHAGAPGVSFTDWLRDWLWPNPRAWAGLAAAWALALALNHAAAPEVRTASTPAPAPAGLASLQLQRQELYALLDFPPAPTPPPPRRDAPKPHSQFPTLNSHA